MKTNQTTFKRLPIGALFLFSPSKHETPQKFRKETQTGAYRIKENGQGETHKLLPFSRSAGVNQA